MRYRPCGDVDSTAGPVTGDTGADELTGDDGV